MWRPHGDSGLTPENPAKGPDAADSPAENLRLGVASDPDRLPYWMGGCHILRDLLTSHIERPHA